MDKVEKEEKRADEEISAEDYKKIIQARIASEVQDLRPEDIRDLLPAEERARRNAEAERLERELLAELGE